MRSALLLPAAWLMACGAPSDPAPNIVDGGPFVRFDGGQAMASDAGHTDGGPASDLCPPTGPFGVREGDTLAELMLPDCDGNMHSFHALCGKQASWIYTFAGW